MPSQPERPPAGDAHPCAPRTVLRLVVACACLPLVTGCPQLLGDNFETQGSFAIETPPDTAAGGDATEPLTTPDRPSSMEDPAGEGGSANAEGGNGAGGSTSSTAGAGGVETGGGGQAGAGGTAQGASSSGNGGMGGSTPTNAGGNGGAGGSQATETCEPETEYCDGRDNDCDDDIDEDVCDDSCVGFAFEGHGYASCDTTLTATEAQAACEEDGMYLVEIGSPEENVEVLSHAPDASAWTTSTQFGRTPGAWIGATATDDLSEWSWSTSGTLFWTGAEDGSAPAGVFVNWARGQPSNTGGDQTCAGMYVEEPSTGGDAGQWNDAGCSGSLPYFCEAD